MKTFHHKVGTVACTTMTVVELKEFLSKFPDDIPVMEEWEGGTVGRGNEGYRYCEG